MGHTVDVNTTGKQKKKCIAGDRAAVSGTSRPWRRYCTDCAMSSRCSRTAQPYMWSGQLRQNLIYIGRHVIDNTE